MGTDLDTFDPFSHSDCENVTLDTDLQVQFARSAMTLIAVSALTVFDVITVIGLWIGCL